MQLTITKRTDKTIEVELPGENETLLNLLKQKLLATKKVSTASYVMGHPLLDRPHFMLEVESGNPETVLRSAAKELRADFDEMDDLLVKKTK